MGGGLVDKENYATFGVVEVSATESLDQLARLS
ncbi:hypothetical protein SV7mr_06450 [Stieleria bergensis]|uniref:Uncharacterized protein n=1 Tax=Stieleria bergensis TaxID=2528025 RepID=A0A517SPV2_9BACT|nr:hypothetical protein SV7mr_06450 [Planctomycetes bacterium SV_7m_r]